MLDDAILGQLVQLQVVEGLPRADDRDVCGRKGPGSERIPWPRDPHPCGPVSHSPGVALQCAEWGRADPGVGPSSGDTLAVGEGGCGRSRGGNQRRVGLAEGVEAARGSVLSQTPPLTWCKCPKWEQPHLPDPVDLVLSVGGRSDGQAGGL